MTASALSALLAAVREQGLPEVTDRGSIREARNRIVQSNTQYGPVLQHVECYNIDDELMKIPVAHPFATLWVCLSETESGFKDHFLACLVVVI